MENEKRLIDANALKIAFTMREMADIDMYGGCHIAECFQGYEANEIVDKMPTVDAVEVVHGRWERTEHHGFLRCSKCKDVYIDDSWVADGKWNYCPNCGAKMDGGKTND